MKQILTTLLLVAALAPFVKTRPLNEQAPRPNPLSPRETKTFEVDGATITISYGRPSMRGRKIFGGLRPFGVLWMPGADEASRLDTSADLRFGEVVLPRGSYTLYTIPGEKTWTLIISKELGQFHTSYHKDQDFARLDMNVSTLPEPVERLTIHAIPATGGGGLLAIDWETTRAYVPFTVVR